MNPKGHSHRQGDALKLCHALLFPPSEKVFWPFLSYTTTWTSRPSLLNFDFGDLWIVAVIGS